MDVNNMDDIQCEQCVLTIHEPAASPGVRKRICLPTDVSDLIVNSLSRDTIEDGSEDLGTVNFDESIESGQNNRSNVLPASHETSEVEILDKVHGEIIRGNVPEESAGSLAESFGPPRERIALQGRTGKLYHAFFVHAFEDRGWVSEVMARLESPEYSLKCCSADRKFDLGVPVCQNITKCVQTSVKTVVVLSPSFSESPWCSYITRMTVGMDLDKKQRLLVPVMLRPCRVPEFIGRLNPIEVQNEFFWDRFIAALDCASTDNLDGSALENLEQSSLDLSTQPDQLSPYYRNSDPIVKLTIADVCSCSESNPRPDDIPSELTTHGMRFDVEDYNKILTILYDQCYIKCHGCFAPGLTCGTVSCITLFGLLFLILNIIFNYPNKLSLGMISMWAAPFSLSLIYLICRLAMCSRAAKQFTRAVHDLQTIACRYDTLLGFQNSGRTCGRGYSTVIGFYYYNWQPCHSHLQRRFFNGDQLEESHTNSDVDIFDEIVISEREHLIGTIPTDESDLWTILFMYASEYGQLLAVNKLKIPAEQRHTRQGECLCQFVESILSEERENRSCCQLTNIFGVKSRYRWRRVRMF